MVLDFSKIDLKENPMLILRTNNGEPIGILGYANNISAEIFYNEMSKLTFRVPAFVEMKPTPQYYEVIGTRIIDLKDVGQFILMNPKTRNDGIKEIKECTAYSLEYEFVFKKISLEAATYNFWNPVSRKDTILGIIMEKMPSWSVGAVDSDLIGKYRTFDVNNENLYDVIKNKLQRSYQCVFEFDTCNRKVNVRSVNSAVTTEPVYISFQNLIKEVEIEENSENIYTCLDVSGADGVDIRSVNPMGTNKLYDLSYFMNTTNFTQQVIDKYNSWKATFESYQLPYYNLSVENALKVTEMLTEQAALTDLYGQLKNLENQQAVTIQSIAQKLKTQSDLNAINSQISLKSSEINAKKSVIASIDSQISSVNAQMVVINNATAFSAFFAQDELLMLDKYVKEDSIAESSFVAPAVKNYNTVDMSNTITNTTYSITGATVTKVANSLGKDIYTVTGGTLSVTTGIRLNAEIVKASYEVDSSRSFLFTAYFKSGSVDGTSFPSGCISLTGTISGVTSSDVLHDATLPQIYRGTRVSFTVQSARFYFTQNTTIYEQRSVEWDLYDYGQECLSKVSTPSFSFSVDMANFIGLDEFIIFKKSLKLGNKVYLRLDDEKVLQPIVIGATIDFEDLSKFKVEFGSTYKSGSSTFNLSDLLNQSISMGSKVDFSQFNYNAWVESGAETSVSQFITSALDVAKNAILSSKGQVPTLDETGLRIRKTLDNGDYSPKQLWAVSNSIMMTSDNWNTAELAIGEFVDDNAGTCWGVVAKNIVGTLLAGNNLIIESAKKDGGKSVFRVDGNGAALYNATFDLYNGSNTQITLNPYSGIAIGKYPLYTGNNYTINTNNAQFWVDTAGNVHIKGELHGVTGTFSGSLEAATGRFKGVVQASDYQDLYGRSMLTSAYKFGGDYIDAKGIVVRNSANAITFMVDGSGNVTVSGSITMGSGSSINWGYVNAPSASQVGAISNVANAITSTHISSGAVTTPKLAANAVTANNIAANAITADKLSVNNLSAISANLGTVTAGTMTGVTVNFGNWGSLRQSYGSNGVTTTDLVELYSSRGIRLQAGSGGLGLVASGEIWVDSPINFKYNGSWIRNIAASINSNSSSISNLSSSINSLTSRVAALEAKVK